MDAAAIQGLTEALQNLVAPPAAHAVSVKLPSLWTDNPALWFTRAEAQFAAAKVTQDDTKFNHVVSILDNATANEISPLLTNPPTTEKYAAIKTALIKVYGKPQEVKDAELLNIAGLGDRKPSGLLRYMQSLGGSQDTLLRAFWLAQLPPPVRLALATSAESNIEALADLADKVFFASQHTSVSALEPQSTSSATEVNSSTEVFICRYHKSFGMAARKCSRGCAFADLVDRQPTSVTNTPRHTNQRRTNRKENDNADRD